ncbi:uncharacterized protein LAJ45_07295 [Morchella importuna]|uniref:uncharacterized protein n=1 Tax=Morchella importuna TaxID=1174673 RepID=UPI001E8CC205|nr:uncharacterized protein LAJ45_07295 [Morchella importuna]KAH8148584.1 hypothetical protein LAJ45_07295 [Morchella importuna]
MRQSKEVKYLTHIRIATFHTLPVISLKQLSKNSREPSSRCPTERDQSAFSLSRGCLDWARISLHKGKKALIDHHATCS